MTEVLEIIEPKFSDLKIPLNLPIILHGIARDKNEKDLSEQITWNSDKDGSLGKGGIIKPYLTAGTHTITASITVNNKNLSKKISLKVIHEDKPPITIRSLIKLAWGLTMNFSHDDNQRTLAESIKDKILGIFESYQNTKFDNNNKFTYYPTPDTKNFFDNVILSMTTTIRNIGFSRNNHQNSLHALSTEYKNTQKYYEDLASFTSFKKSGIAPKIIAFLGGGTTGSLTSLVTEFSTKIFPEQDAASIDALNATIQTITDPEVVEQANNQLSNIVQSTTQFPAIEISIFLITGAITLAFVNIFFIWHKKRKLGTEKARIVCEQKKYYVKKYRRNMALMLFNFYNDIENLARKFYRIDYLML